MPKLRLSYSSLQYFFESGCPRAWAFRQEIRPKVINPFAATGILVHKIMAGEVGMDDQTDKTVRMYVEKLTTLYIQAGIKITEQEFWREFDILPGVKWVAKIDFRGTDNTGMDVLGDWKTTSNGWKHASELASMALSSPVAASFQGSGYLHRQKVEKWPRTLFNLVVGFRGPGEIIPYTYNKKDDENLLDAIQVVKHQKLFPKVYGKHCLGVKPDGSDRCDFFTACFKTKGWQDDYDKRDNA